MLTLVQILKATGGTLLSGGLTPKKFSGVSIDSRTLKPGNIFIAICGEKFDGHRFVAQALAKGTALLIVSKKVSAGKQIPVILVKDTTKALGEIARAHRSNFKIPVIAVTGSAGKTTTKDMMAAVLGARFKVLKNLKTLNNQYGVSLTLLKLNSSHQAVVLEVGTNNPGEIRWLTYIANPTVAVLTNIGESHLEGLKDHKGVYKEKSDLVRGMESGHVIFNNDDPFLRKIHSHKRLEKVTYGIEQKSDFSPRQIEVKNNRKICFHLNGHGFILNTPAPYYVYNALAAIACGRLFKISFPQIKRKLGKLKFADQRQQMRDVGGITIIDDTYNSNPVSMRNAVKTIDSLKARGKKIFITADMLELGVRSKALHEAKGRLIAESTINVALTVGKLSRHAADNIRKLNGGIKVLHCAEAEAVPAHLKGLCGPGDIVLVKGSRGMRMERVVEFLHHHLNKKS